ncbi:MAG: DUF4012 domain-containing protein [Actinomycetota bacterium]
MSEWATGGSTGAGPHGERSRGRRRRRRSQAQAQQWPPRPRIGRWILIGLGVVALLAFLDASYSGFTLYRELEAARNALETGAARLQSGDVAGAQASFASAQTAARRAVGATDHPVPRVAGVLPFIDDDLDAIRSLGRAADLSAQAGESLAVAAEEIGWNGRTLPWFEQGGSYDLEVIRTAEPTLGRAAAALGEADRIVSPLSTQGLFSPVRNALETAQTTVGDRARLAQRAHLLTQLLPPFLGDEEERTYAIVMMNLSDPRGSGGYPGSYGLLHVDRGEIQLQELAPTSSLGTVPPVDAPEDVRARYGRFGALTDFISTTYSPDWPTSARLWMQMWTESGRPPLDGVIGADSVWLQHLLETIGPVATPAWPTDITATNVNRILNADTFRTTSQKESDAWQTGIGTALWQALLERPIAPVEFGGALGAATAERHLQIYVEDPEEERWLYELGASGTVTLPPEGGPIPIMVTWEGQVASRTGYWAETAIDVTTESTDAGTTRVTITTTLENTAPTSAPESILYGFEGDGYPLGAYSAAVNVYLPIGAVNITTDGGALIGDIGEEFGHPVATNVLYAPAGKQDTARVSYEVPRAVTDLSFMQIVQPALRPTELVIPT